MFKALISVLLLASSVDTFAQVRRVPRGPGPGPGPVHRPGPGPGPVRRPAPIPGPVRRPTPIPGPVRRYPGPVVRRQYPGYRLPYRTYRTRPFPGYGVSVSLGTVQVYGDQGTNTYEQVDSCSFIGEGRISAIKLRTLGDDVNVYNVRVRFEDGSSVTLPRATGHLYARGETVWVDLPGTSRCVDSVQIFAADQGGGRPATIEILGMVGRYYYY